MPSALTSNRAQPAHDDLDNYDVDDFSDDPFASPPPGPGAASKKRKEPQQDDVGIDKEVSVQKRARVPNVKLDEQRLLGDNGIPKLRTRASGLKIKGKGHEFSDAARLLSFYQLWLDDLFPKARFLDALAMVEKAGHKKTVVAARNEWISQDKRKKLDDEYNEENGDAAAAGGPSTPPAAAAAAAATATNAGDGDDIPDEEDLYGTSPRQPRLVVRSGPPAAQTTANDDDVPDEDDLDALIAEAETHDPPRQPTAASTTNLNHPNNLPSRTPPPPPPQQQQQHPPQEEEQEDDLDALIAEAEAEDGQQEAQKQNGKGDGKVLEEERFEDDEAAMREMEGMW